MWGLGDEPKLEFMATLSCYRDDTGTEDTDAAIDDPPQ